MGDDGIYRLYRLYPSDGRCEQRHVATLGIFGGRIIHVEDHDGILGNAFPEGPLTARLLRRLLALEDAGYWRLISGGDIERQGP